MRRFIAILVFGVGLCAGMYQSETYAGSKPRGGDFKLFRSRTLQHQTPAASAHPVVKIQGHPIGDRLSPVIGRVNNSFQSALVYKPNDETVTDEERQFAALVVQETPIRGKSVPDHLRMGAVVTDPSGRTVVDAQRPTVYTAESHLMLKSVSCQQRVQVWAYAGAEVGNVVWRGVRVTYGPHKYPVIWEVLGAEGEPTVLFLCSTVEAAAEKEYGKAFPGRKSSTEWTLDEQPEVVVARILPPGAQPAGPMVYLDAGKTVNTLLCRCMPAQADRLSDGPSYDVLPLQILGDVQIASDGPFRLVKSATPQVSDGGRPWLERVLRLPSQF